MDAIQKYLNNEKTITSSGLKELLYKYELKENKCEICGLGHIWHNTPISNQLDHIDGNNQNNNLDNLRIICPNCHSQTETFVGRHHRRINKKKLIPLIDTKDKFLKLIKDHDCIKSILESVGAYSASSGNYQTLKNYAKMYEVVLPSYYESERMRRTNSETNRGNFKIEELQSWADSVKIIGMTAVAKTLKISDVALRKRLKTAGFDVNNLSPFSNKKSPRSDLHGTYNH